MEDSLEGTKLIAPVMDEDEEVESSHQLLVRPSQPPPTYLEEETVTEVSGVHGQTRPRRYWIVATVVLCLYGFFKEFKPSEPFLTPYLTSSVKNFTKDQVNSQIYTYWPYSYLVSAFFVFLFTDLLRYKPIILLEGVAYLSTRLLLIWGTTVNDMRLMQVAYGVATATEIAYFSYIYLAVSEVHYKKVTSYVRAVRLLGQSMAGLLGQLLISLHWLDYLALNYISLVSVSLACIVAIFLPHVYDCTFCTSCPPSMQACRSAEVAQNSFGKWFSREVMGRVRDFVKFYRQINLLRWSVWWALAMCGVLQVGNYVQSLWKEVAESSGETNKDETKVYNGLVEAMATLCSAGAAFLLSFLRVNWSLWGEAAIGVLSLLDAAVLFLSAVLPYLWAVYLCHIAYRTTYSFLITIASTQLALQVDHKSYALIFGFNTFLALILQTVLTLVVADERGLDLPIPTQFIVYSGYYFVLTLIFLFAGVFKLTSEGWISSFRRCWIPRSRELAPSRMSQDDLPIIQAINDEQRNNKNLS